MRRHAFDPVSMILGAVFTLIGVTFLVGDVNVANLPPALTWPVPLVVVGLAVIALAVGGSRADRQDEVAGAPAGASDAEPRVDHPTDSVDAVWHEGSVGESGAAEHDSGDDPIETR